MNRVLHLTEEAARCMLCQDAPCSQVCRSGNPARAIRAIRFGNEKLASHWIIDCTDDEDLERAERACIHYDRPIRIKEMLCSIDRKNITTDKLLPSLDIDFCGIHCENPFFLASSAVCTNYEMVARAFDAGWGGVFYKTICLQEIKEVQTEEQWIELAKMAEKSGVDAIELNFSCPQMHLAGMGSDVGQNSELVLFYTAYVKRSVSIPVIPKMTPNITHITEPAMAAYFANADAISAINTIKSVTMGGRARVSGHKTISGLSGRAVRPIALRHILEISQSPVMSKVHEKNIELSGIGGIETWRDALEFIQLGCRNVQVCTAVMQYGYRIIDDLILGLQSYMAERKIKSLSNLVGEELSNFVTPTDLDRTTIVYPKIDLDRCIGCGRCYVSCMDGGHQAITFDIESRRPRIVGTHCVGCHLCRLVCPTEAINVTKRVNKK